MCRAVRPGRLPVVHPDLELALELADVADAITHGNFRRGDLRVERKPDLTLVTKVDLAVERALRERLEAARPDDGILGEELGERTPGTSRRWILDPLDGTHGYLRGIPIFATLIALEQNGRIEVGVVSAPGFGHRWWAVRGQGAFVDGLPIHVSGVDRLEDAQLSFDSPTGFEKRGLSDRFLALARRCWRTRAYGDFWQHMLVAEGAVDVVVEPFVSVWDLAATGLIVEEAGGRFTDLSGQARPDGGSAVSTNGLLHDEVLRELGTAGGEGP
jgi:histidinol-phosphatase